MSDKQDNPHLPWNHRRSNFEDVLAFRKKIGLPIATSPQNFVTPEDGGFWRRFLQEELNEFERAKDNKDLGEQFDALLDLVYVAMGAAAVLGLPWQEGWDRVHAANMQKEPGVKPGRSGHPDAVKPEGWTAPDLTDLVTGREE